MTAAGDLKWRVRFDKPEVNTDPFGGSVRAWVAQFDRAAEFKPMKGGEGVHAQRLAGTQPQLLIVRFDSKTRTIDPSWRAVEMLNDVEVKFYALKTAEDMERKREYITMIAIEGVADGGDGDA